MALLPSRHCGPLRREPPLPCAVAGRGQLEEVAADLSILEFQKVPSHPLLQTSGFNPEAGTPVFGGRGGFLTRCANSTPQRKPEHTRALAHQSNLLGWKNSPCPGLLVQVFCSLSLPRKQPACSTFLRINRQLRSPQLLRFRRAGWRTAEGQEPGRHPHLERAPMASFPRPWACLVWAQGLAPFYFWPLNPQVLITK